MMHIFSVSTDYIHLRYNRQFFFLYTLQEVFWQFYVGTRARRGKFGIKAILGRVSLHALCVHWIPRVGAESGSFTSFLFACLNCDLYLFIQVQEDTKESLVQSFCPWDAALCVRTEHGASTQFRFSRLCLNSFECLNWQGLKTRTNDKLSRRRTAVARQRSRVSFYLSQLVETPPPPPVGPYNRHHLSPH